MRKFNKISIVVVGMMAVFMLLSPASYAKTILKCGTSTQPDHIYNKAVEKFAKIVKEKTTARSRCSCFPRPNSDRNGTWWKGFNSAPWR